MGSLTKIITFNDLLAGCAAALLSTGAAVTFNFETNPWLTTFTGFSGVGGAIAGRLTERSTTNRRDFYRKSKVEQVLKEAESVNFGIEGQAALHYLKEGLKDV